MSSHPEARSRSIENLEARTLGQHHVVAMLTAFSGVTPSEHSDTVSLKLLRTVNRKNREIPRLCNDPIKEEVVDENCRLGRGKEWNLHSVYQLQYM